MNKSQQIRDGLSAFAAKYGPMQAILAKVNSVNEADFTCECDYEGITLYDVRLRPVINAKESITFFPKVGGYVLAARIENSEEDWMVIACDEVDKVRIVCGDTSFESDGQKFEVKNSAASLKDILTNLLTEVVLIYAPKNVANLNLIKEKVNLLLK